MTGRVLENQTALITGASRGIGRAVAQTLARAGAAVGLVARDETGLKEVARDIAAGGGQALPIPGDVAKFEDVGAAVAQAQSALGPVDILVNAAGFQPPIGPFLENDPRAWEHNLRVNLLGPAFFIRAVAPLMQARGLGKIINFSGGGAAGPRIRFSAYGTAKAALVRLTETLALELKEYNIQVNAVAPGAVNTQMLDEILAAGEKAGPEYQQALERARNGGAPVESVCDLVLFLASPASGGLTGKLISALHDPWRQWSGQTEKVNAVPLYTLRRLDPYTLKPLMGEFFNR
jgi:3-oxoacyl-[acyl-carrier protein] reductase